MYLDSCAFGCILTYATTDNTNADPETRAVWIKLAERFGIPIRCVHFTAPSKLCEHNDTVRAISQGGFNPEKRTILPHSAFAGFASRFKPPKIEEGFQDIVRVEFQVGSDPLVLGFCSLTILLPDQFVGDDKERRIWSQYWI